MEQNDEYKTEDFVWDSLRQTLKKKTWKKHTHTKREYELSSYCLNIGWNTIQLCFRIQHKSWLHIPLYISLIAANNPPPTPSTPFHTLVTHTFGKAIFEYVLFLGPTPIATRNPLQSRPQSSRSPSLLLRWRDQENPFAHSSPSPRS